MSKEAEPFLTLIPTWTLVTDANVLQSVCQEYKKMFFPQPNSQLRRGYRLSIYERVLSSLSAPSALPIVQSRVINNWGSKEWRFP